MSDPLPTETMLALVLDRDTAGHLALAIQRYRDALRERRRAEPPRLADLERLARGIVGNQETSRSVTVRAPSDDGCDERDYLTRRDVVQLTGTSTATVDRWIRSGSLASTKHGRIRRISRDDLATFLSDASKGQHA